MKRAAIVQKTHGQKKFLTPANLMYREAILKYTVDEMKKDSGAGDVTTNIFFKKNQRARAVVIAKQAGVCAGEQEIVYFLKKVGGIKAQFLKHDGQWLKSGDAILDLHGTVADLMKTERIILNVIGRMSGIATLTRAIVKKVNRINSKTLVTPTRKTLWGLLDKRACVMGGGGTHRLSLDNAILIKHNHLKASGSSISRYLEVAIKKAPKNSAFLEVEVSNLKDALSAASIFSRAKKSGFALPCFIMFDNMSPSQIRTALATIKKNNFGSDVLFEASGGITKKNILSFAKTGVDVLSLGSLTHSAPMLDVSMRIISQ